MQERNAEGQKKGHFWSKGFKSELVSSATSCTFGGAAAFLNLCKLV